MGQDEHFEPPNLTPPEQFRELALPRTSGAGI